MIFWFPLPSLKSAWTFPMRRSWSSKVPNDSASPNSTNSAAASADRSINRIVFFSLIRLRLRPTSGSRLLLNPKTASSSPKKILKSAVRANSSARANPASPTRPCEHLSDVKLIQQARIEAQSLYEFDPKLEKFPILKNNLEKFDKNIHLE